MERISNAIKCVNCRHVMSIPIIMPCGHSICKAHIEDNNEVICEKCSQKHQKNSVYINEALAEMIAARIGSLEFGQGHKEALQSCEQLNNAISQIDRVLNDSDTYVFEVFSDLRRQADLKYEELRLKIDQEWQLVLAELNSFERECMQMIKSSSSSSLSDLKDANEATRRELDHYVRFLNALNFDEVKWTDIKKNCATKITILQDKLNDFKGSLITNDSAFKIGFDLHSAFGLTKEIIFSNILTGHMKKNFMELCEFDPKTKFSLLYRGSRDGFKAKDFHAKCDDKSKTLTIIKTTKNYVFGGYTEASWGGSICWKRDPNAFLFSLINIENRPIKMRIAEGKEDEAIFAIPTHGPTFGSGHEILIESDFNINSSYFGENEIDMTYRLNSTNPNNFLAGSINFQVAEIEVFQLV